MTKWDYLAVTAVLVVAGLATAVGGVLRIAVVLWEKVRT